MWTNRVVAIIGRKNGSFSIGDGRPLNFPVVAELSPFDSFKRLRHIRKILGVRRTPHELLTYYCYLSVVVRLFVPSFCLVCVRVDLLNGMTDGAGAWDQYYCRWAVNMSRLVSRIQSIELLITDRLQCIRLLSTRLWFKGFSSRCFRPHSIKVGIAVQEMAKRCTNFYTFLSVRRAEDSSGRLHL